MTFLEAQENKEEKKKKSSWTKASLIPHICFFVLDT